MIDSYSIETLESTQINIFEQISNISKEIKFLESFSDEERMFSLKINNKKIFSLADFDRLNKLKKQVSELKTTYENNSHHLREAKIDSVLMKIKNVTNGD